MHHRRGGELRSLPPVLGIAYNSPDVLPAIPSAARPSRDRAHMGFQSSVEAFAVKRNRPALAQEVSLEFGQAFLGSLIQFDIGERAG
jgi:hypothetical protein